MNEQLGAQEQKVASYIRLQGSEIIRQSIGEIAVGSGTSESTVVRFCQSLGYNGLKDFKIHFFQMGARIASSTSELKWDDDDQAIFRKVHDGAVSALENSFTKRNETVIKTMADLFCQDRNIDIYGVGGSGFIASYARHQLQKLGLRINAYTDIHGQNHCLSHFKEGDIVMVVSCSGETKDVVEAIQCAKQAHSIILVMTDNPDSSLGKMADYMLVSKSDTFFCDDVNSYSRIAQLALVDALYISIAIRMASMSADFKEAYVVRTEY